VELPEGPAYELFDGGKYSRFVHDGAYSDLSQAAGRVFEIVAETKIRQRDDFCIENYVNDPRTSPRSTRDRDPIPTA
jgi:DNA gyrase inhibitor GyrI